MPHTLAETLELCRGSDSCDPLFDTSDPSALERISETPEGLLLLGIDDESDYGLDLLITPVENGWTVQYRDPIDAIYQIFGREWCGSGTVFEDWSELVSAVYSL